jgi:hypothetical protein
MTTNNQTGGPAGPGGGITITGGNSTTLTAGGMITMPSSGWQNYWATSPTTYSGYNTTNILSSTSTSTIFTLFGKGGPLVELDIDGNVRWTNSKVKVDEAAEAFSSALKIGTELSIGITDNVKKQIRDSLFEEIIKIAETDGALTADQLTFMHRSVKIMDKLKSGKIN